MALPSLKQAEAGEDQIHLIVLPKDGAQIIDQVRQKIGEGGISLEELFLERGRLDDVFRDLTKAA